MFKAGSLAFLATAGAQHTTPSSHNIETYCTTPGKTHGLNPNEAKIWSQWSALKQDIKPMTAAQIRSLGKPVSVYCAPGKQGISFYYTFKNCAKVGFRFDGSQDDQFTPIAARQPAKGQTCAAPKNDDHGETNDYNERMRVLQAFKAHDKNHDGHITSGGAYAAMLTLLEPEDSGEEVIENQEAAIQHIVDSVAKDPNPSDPETVKVLDYPAFVKAAREVEIIRKAQIEFDQVDKNKDGKVTVQELSSLLGAFMTTADAQAIIDARDKNGDNVVSFTEYYTYIINNSNKNEPHQLTTMKTISKSSLTEDEIDIAQSDFDFFDTNGDGSVAGTEVKAMATQVYHNNPQSPFGRYLYSMAKSGQGVFKDGKLNNDEWLEALTSIKAYAVHRNELKSFDDWLGSIDKDSCQTIGTSCSLCVSKGRNAGCVWVADSSSKPGPIFGPSPTSKGKCTSRYTLAPTKGQKIVTSTSQCFARPADGGPQVMDGKMWRSKTGGDTSGPSKTGAKSLRH